MITISDHKYYYKIIESSYCNRERCKHGVTMACNVFLIIGLLQSEVFQLKEHLSSMARELAERDGRDERGGERERDSLGAGSTQDEGETDSLGEIKPGKKLIEYIWHIILYMYMYIHGTFFHIKYLHNVTKSIILLYS